MQRFFSQLTMVILITALTAMGQIPQTISYQGVLTDNTGTLVADGDYSIEFNLYNVSTAGSPLWTETQTVTITDGIFNVKLGAVNLLNLPFNEVYWLGITIDSGSELSPRIELTSSAYSLNARSVKGENNVFPSVGNVGIGTDNPSAKLDVSGALRISATDNLPSNANYALYMTGNVSGNEIGKIYVGDNSGWKLHFSSRANNADTDLMTIQDNGNIGIGITDPTEMLQVADTIYSSVGGFKFPDGTIQETAATGGSSLWQVNGPNIYYNSGNIGIGTDNPFAKLDVQMLGTGNWQRGIRLLNPDLVTGNKLMLTIGAFDDINNAGNIYFNYHGNGAPENRLSLGLYAVDDVLNIMADGNVGIGTTSPTEMLQVADTIYSSVGGFKFPDGTVQETAATGGGNGDITAVTAGNGLTGGGVNGDVTLDVVPGVGIQVQPDEVRLDLGYADGRFVNEGQLNSVATGMITDGAVTGPKLASNAVTQTKIANNAVTAAKISPNIVSSIEGVNNDGGNIDLIEGANITITPNNVANTITISAATSGGGNTLDQAYDQGGLGAGRAINADNGAVNIQGSGGLTVNGNVGIGTNTPVYSLSIMPGTSVRGINIDHNQSGSGTTHGLYVDLDKTYVGTSEIYGGEFQATNNNGTGATYGLNGEASGTSTGLKYGVRGEATGAGTHFGVYGFATGSGTQYGIFGAATGSGNLWAGYFGSGNVHIANQLGIGTSNPLSTLSVGGDGTSSAAISGETADLSGQAIRGNASNTGATTNYGGVFYAAGETGRAVYGYASNTGDVVNYGGRFIAAGEDGIGVYGAATDIDWGMNYGGYFVANNINSYGVYADAVRYGVYGRGGQFGVSGYITDGTGDAIRGDIGSTTGNYAGYFRGNVECTGGYTKSFSKNKIDHPLDPENKYLYHSSVESSDMMNVYNGNVLLDSYGEVWVEMPDWFGALNKDFRYQLTCIGGFAQVYIAEEVQNNRFKIGGGKSGMKISWQITGIRKDKLAEQFPVVVEKDKPAEERGKYLHPQAFGLDESRGIGYEESMLLNSKENNSINQHEEDVL